MYSCHLFSISSASFRSIPFLSFIVPILAWNIPLVSLISYLSFLFFGTQHSDAYIFPFLLCLSLLFFLAISKASSDNCFALLPFFILGMVLITASYKMLWTTVHSSSGTLSDRIPWVYLSLPLCNHKVFDLGQTWMAYWLSLLSSI